MSTDRISPAGTPFTAGSVVPTITQDGSATVPHLHGTMQLRVQFVPDQWVLHDDHFQQWLSKTETTHPNTWEDLATRMIEGFYDALLPKTVTLTLLVRGQGLSHEVELTKAQPQRKK